MVCANNKALADNTVQAKLVNSNSIMCVYVCCWTRLCRIGLASKPIKLYPSIWTSARSKRAATNLTIHTHVNRESSKAFPKKKDERFRPPPGEFASQKNRKRRIDFEKLISPPHKVYARVCVCVFTNV